MVVIFASELYNSVSLGFFLCLGRMEPLRVEGVGPQEPRVWVLWKPEGCSIGSSMRG